MYGVSGVIPSNDPRWKRAATQHNEMGLDDPEAVRNEILETYDVLEKAHAALFRTPVRMRPQFFKNPSKAKHAIEKMAQARARLSDLMTDLHALSKDVRDPVHDTEVVDYPDSAER